MDVFVGFNDSAEEEQKSLKYSKIINDLENDILEIESLSNSGRYQKRSCTYLGYYGHFYPTLKSLVDLVCLSPLTLIFSICLSHLWLWMEN